MRSGLLAQLLTDGSPIRQVPPDCIGIVIANDGTTTRHAVGQSLRPPWQKSFLVTTIPQRCQLCLHPACPEILLDLRYVVDSADPRLAQQRFDLFLASEITQDWSCADMAAQLQTLLQAEMASGNLDCHPQMSLPEWMRFRAQLERWLYIRFGLTVEDCALVDAGETFDYAQILLERAHAVAQTGAATLPPLLTPTVASSAASAPIRPSVVAANARCSATNKDAAPQPPNTDASPLQPANTDVSPNPPNTNAPPRQSPNTDASPQPPISSMLSATEPTPPADGPPALPSRHVHHAGTDSQQLRRLFLELPDFIVRWRALNPPSAFFTLQQTILQRLSVLKTTVAAMPALELAAPQQALAAWQIAVRRQAMRDALQAWEQAWGLLARLQPASTTDIWLAWSDQSAPDEIERIVANFEHALARRAQVPQEQT